MCSRPPALEVSRFWLGRGDHEANPKFVYYLSAEYMLGRQLRQNAVGYGIRYEFGIFEQAFEDGDQVEHPDDWAFYGNPWEFPAPDDLQVVGFYGRTEPVDDQGGLRARWLPGEMVRDGSAPNQAPVNRLYSYIIKLNTCGGRRDGA